MRRRASYLFLPMAVFGIGIWLWLTLVGIQPASAAIGDPITFTPEVPIPGLFEGTRDVDNNFFGTYIRAVYVYFIWVVGVLAGVMIVWGGIKWVSAAGNPSKIGDARDTINSAIIGIIIALTSVVMLNIINPNLTRIGLPGLPTAQRTPFVSGADAICDYVMNVPCGEMRDTGVPFTAPNGTVKNTVCLGTICNTTSKVCPILSVIEPIRDARTGSQIGSRRVYQDNGPCSDSIELVAGRPDDYRDVSTLRPHSEAGNPRACSLINRVGRTVGSDCPKTFACSQQGNCIPGGTACYIETLPAIVIDEAGDDDDHLTSMRCPNPGFVIEIP